MTKDHFIAQTYLRHFGDPACNGMLHAYRKSDGKYFPCHTKDVCHEWDGDLNPLLVQNDMLGSFRKIFEPHWNQSISTLLSKTISPNEMFAVAGYFANLMVCTPTWRRIGVKMYNDHAIAFLSFSKKMQEKHGGNSSLPVEAIKAMERGEITHDPDYIKAKTTQSLMHYAWLTYHQDWVIIRNTTPYPFLTSDNPVAVHNSANLQEPMTRFLPITPTLCLSVCYKRTKLPPVDSTLSPKGILKWGNATEEGAKQINKLVAKCAEELVFSSTKSIGTESLVKNCARFWVDVDFVQLPAAEPDAVYDSSIIRVCERKKSAA